MATTLSDKPAPYDRKLVAAGIKNTVSQVLDPPHFADVRATDGSFLAHPLARALSYGCLAMITKRGVSYLLRTDGSALATFVTGSERRGWSGMYRMFVVQDPAPDGRLVIDVRVGYGWCTAAVVDASGRTLTAAPSLAGWCYDGAGRPNWYVRPTVASKRRRVRDFWEQVDEVGTRQAVMSIHRRAVYFDQRWWSGLQPLVLVSFRSDLDLVGRLTAFASVWARHAQQVKDAESAGDY